MSHRDFGWNSSDDFLKAVLTSILAGFLYLMFVSVGGGFQLGYVAYAGIFAVLAVAFSAVAEKVNIDWAVLSGLLFGVSMSLQSLAAGQGANSLIEALIVISNIPIMAVIFAASYMSIKFFAERGEW